MNNGERETERDWDREGGNVMTLLKIVVLTNWWVSAVFRDFSLQVHLSACLSVSCFIVRLLSMPDFQLHPDSPNDNAAGKREVADGRWVNKRSPNHHSPASYPFPLLPCQPVWTAPGRSNLFVIPLFLFMSVCLQPDHIAAVRTLTALSVVHVSLY